MQTIAIFEPFEKRQFEPFRFVFFRKAIVDDLDI